MIPPAYKHYLPNRMTYKDGYKVVTEDGFYVQTCIYGADVTTAFARLMPDGLLFVHPKFPHDGATGVPQKKWILPWIKRAAAVHDVLAQMLRLCKLDRAYIPTVQETFRQICLDDGAWLWQANLARWIVTQTQGSYTRPSADRVVKVAP